MHLLLLNPRGFCAGVKMAIHALDVALNQFGPPIYVFHEIVHNTWIVNDFSKRGVIFVDDMSDVPSGNRLLFSAHGVDPVIRHQAMERNIQTIDATCPLVAKIHREARNYAEKAYQIVLIGHKGHDEIVGIFGESPQQIHVVESENQIDQLNLRQDEKIAYLTQTTLSVDETALLVGHLRNRFPHLEGPKSSCICYATQNRQNAINNLAEHVQGALVIGSRSSSNSRRLAERAESCGVCSYLVDGADDITTGWFRGDENVLITAGASAPEHIVQECVHVLKQRFNATCEEVSVRKEAVAFQLPPELSKITTTNSE
ncbi:MAG: 4-hydroxy-3-methylbut-2-enyl diphosphate reductase [Thermoguttaceae bacterium]